MRSGDQGFRFSLRSTSSAERSPEATVAPEGPQGKSPAPGWGRGEGVPATMWDRFKETLGLSPKPDQFRKK